MKDNLKREIYYLYKSKYILFLAVSLALLTILAFYSQVIHLKNSEINYLRIQEISINDNVDITKELNKNFQVKDNKEENLVSIDNSLKYYHLLYQSSLAAFNPTNSINHLFSSYVLILLPIIISVVAIYLSIYDFKNKTLKVVYAFQSNLQYIFTKIITLLLIILFSISYMSIFYFLMNFIYYKFFLRINANIPYISKNISDISFISMIPKQYVFIFFVSLFFSLIFFWIGKMSKSSTLPIGILFIYMLLIPNLGKFDPKNIILYSLPKIFNLNASTFVINEGYKYPMKYLFYWCLIIALINILGSYFSKKESKYN